MSRLSLTWSRTTGLLLATLLGLAACKPTPTQDNGKALLLPALATQQAKLERLELRGAGNKPQVTLLRRGATWQVVERGYWPADAGRLSQYLFVLSQARRSESKTDNPALYDRLGVEPVQSATAKGSELSLIAGKQRSRLLIGDEHSTLDGNYVRVDGGARTWLTDLPVNFDPDPDAWLDHALIDLPLARVARVQATDADGSSYQLTHRDDRFRLDGAPSAAMHDSYAGDKLAGALDQLAFEALAPDDGTAFERELRFLSVDGLLLTLQAWQASDGQSWIRLWAAVDADQSRLWAENTSTNSRPAFDPVRVEMLNRQWQGRRFRLATDRAAPLFASREQILTGAVR